ncbi:hypothetical protein ACWD0A_28010 [Streptomyces sp. NPDC002867]
MGQTESDTAELFCNDARVPGAHGIGEVDQGFLRMLERLPR